MTHINAFFADVEEAAQKVAQANAEYKTAYDRLEAKKREDGLVDQPTVDNEATGSPKEETPQPSKKK